MSRAAEQIFGGSTSLPYEGMFLKCGLALLSPDDAEL